MINCLVVDDEQHAIDVLVHHMKQIPFLRFVKGITDPAEVIPFLDTNKIDLIFLDIHMPMTSGLELAATLPRSIKVIFTTAYSEFAIDGFDLEAVDYLLKPISLPRFFKAVQKVLNMVTSSVKVAADDISLENDYIFVKTEAKGKMLKVNLKEIDYIEGMRNYVAIHHAGNKTLALLNMKDLEDRLPKHSFIRVHKSFLVSINKIIAVEGNLIVLKNIKADIILGDTYRTNFYEILNRKLMG
jgi:two-component system, LytTR family, response regulator